MCYLNIYSDTSLHESADMCHVSWDRFLQVRTCWNDVSDIVGDMYDHIWSTWNCGFCLYAPQAQSVVIRPAASDPPWVHCCSPFHNPPRVSLLHECRAPLQRQRNHQQSTGRDWMTHFSLHSGCLSSLEGEDNYAKMGVGVYDRHWFQSWMYSLSTSSLDTVSMSSSLSLWKQCLQLYSWILDTSQHSIQTNYGRVGLFQKRSYCALCDLHSISIPKLKRRSKAKEHVSINCGANLNLKHVNMPCNSINKPESIV